MKSSEIKALKGWPEKKFHSNYCLSDFGNLEDCNCKAKEWNGCLDACTAALEASEDIVILPPLEELSIKLQELDFWKTSPHELSLEILDWMRSRQ